MGTKYQGGDKRVAIAVVENIDRLIAEQGTNRHRIQIASGIPRTTFYRKLTKKPEHIDSNDLGRIAYALGVGLTELLKAS